MKLQDQDQELKNQLIENIDSRKNEELPERVAEAIGNLHPDLTVEDDHIFIPIEVSGVKFNLCFQYIGAVIEMTEEDMAFQEDNFSGRYQPFLENSPFLP